MRAGQHRAARIILDECGESGGSIAELRCLERSQRRFVVARFGGWIGRNSSIRLVAARGRLELAQPGVEVDVEIFLPLLRCIQIVGQNLKLPA